jgi:hypothetical protein
MTPILITSISTTSGTYTVSRKRATLAAKYTPAD